MSDTLSSDPRLAELQTAIANWRHTRRGRQIPAEIGRATVALLAEYRPKALQRALSIDYKTLMRWKALYSDEITTPVAPLGTETLSAAAFVALTPPPVEAAAPPEVAGEPVVPLATRVATHGDDTPPALALTLTHHPAEGATLSLTGTLSLAQWQSVLTLFQAARA